jgi:signal transduction histidine kinase/ActR/RegA family two-component response regulator
MVGQRASADTSASSGALGENGARTAPAALRAWVPVLRIYAHPSVRFATAAALVGLAFLLRLEPLESASGRIPYITFYPAVMFTAVLGGFRAGLVATAFSALLAWYWFLPPERSFSIGNTADAFGLVAFSLMGVLMSAFAGLYRRVHHRLTASEKDLAVRAIEEKHRAFFENTHDFAVIHQAIRDEHGQVIDWTFDTMNARTREHLEDVFRTMGRLEHGESLLGKRVSELAGTELAAWLSKKWRGVLAGQAASYERSFGGREYAVTAFKMGESTVGTVAFDITDRKRSEDALREADRRKNEFLAVLSHELRNPLAPIRNSIWVLNRVSADSSDAKSAMQVLHRQAQHLTRIVDDLLDVARISRGRIDLRRGHVDLREVVLRSCEDHRSSFEEKEVELRHEMTEAPVWGDVDPTRISQVLGNLLHNAAKFTPARGTVTVELASRGGCAELRVRDTGVGMRPEEVEHMFQPFAQAEQGLARMKGGLGLGLALSKGLVELHGGSLRGRSDGPGRGAEFLVLLPLAAAPAGTITATAPAASTAGGRLVLLIEDNVDTCESLSLALTLAGHRVRSAHDGRTGIAAAREIRPDAVLCDIGLPDMNGYEVAQTLRADEALRSTRLIALSGYARPEDRERASEAGFDAHIAKPPELDELAEVLAKAPAPSAG